MEALGWFLKTVPTVPVPISVPALIFLALFLGGFLAFFLWHGIHCFFACLPASPRNFRGSEARKIPVFLVVSLLFYQKARKRRSGWKNGSDGSGFRFLTLLFLSCHLLFLHVDLLQVDYIRPHADFLHSVMEGKAYRPDEQVSGNQERRGERRGREGGRSAERNCPRPPWCAPYSLSLSLSLSLSESLSLSLSL